VSKDIAGPKQKARADFIGIPIERGIPIPTDSGKGMSGPRTMIGQALVKLQPTESFAVPLEQKSKLASNAHAWAKKLKRKFIVRELNGYARCWRLS